MKMNRILTLVLAAGMVCALTACGTDGSSGSSAAVEESAESSADATTPDGAVTLFLDAVKAEDEDTVIDLYAGDGDTLLDDYISIYTEEETIEAVEALEGDSKETMDTFTELLYSFTYTIGDTETDDDTATVDVTITTYDFGTMFTNWMTDYYTVTLESSLADDEDVTDEEITEAILVELVDDLEELTEQDYTAEVTISLTQDEDGNWILDEFDDTIMNALSGGVTDAINDLYEDSEDDSEDSDEELEIDLEDLLEE